MVVLFNVHPSRFADMRASDQLHASPALQIESFIDSLW